MSPAHGDEAEARRQRELLAALTAPRADAAASPGLRAYRANAHAAAERALGAAFPTVQALLGSEDFAQLARELWHAHPPQRGDLGEWGDALPAWIAAHAGLAEWPYLADCALLDLALHRCERAADAAFDAASLARLSDTDPTQLQLCLMPGVQALASRWPLASIHAAHAGAGADEAGFALVRERLAQQQGEAVVVARAGGRGAVQPIDAAGWAFIESLRVEANLSQALQAAGEAFDFAAWLGDALRCHWLKEARRLDD